MRPSPPRQIVVTFLLGWLFHAGPLSHQPEVMLCVLVTVLGFDDVTCLSSGAGHRHVSHIARLGIDALAGPLPGGTRGESVGAGSKRPGVVSLMSCHMGRGGFGIAALLCEGGGGGGNPARHDARALAPQRFSGSRRGRRPLQERAAEIPGVAGPLEVRVSSTRTVLPISCSPAHGHTKRRSLRASEYT